MLSSPAFISLLLILHHFFLFLWISWEHVSKDGQICSETLSRTPLFKKQGMDLSQVITWRVQEQVSQGWTAGLLGLEEVTRKGLDKYLTEHFRMRDLKEAGMLRTRQDSQQRHPESSFEHLISVDHVFIQNGIFCVWESWKQTNLITFPPVQHCQGYKFTPSFW